MVAEPDQQHSSPDPSGNPGAPPARFAFVGERRSRRAVKLKVRWEDGHLAARTLHAALRAAGFEPEDQIYLNLFDDDGAAPSEPALETLRALVAEGVTVVGMGRIVQRILEDAAIPHLRLVHPAARGAIRTRAIYQAHVATVLGQKQPAYAPDAVA